MGEPTKTFVLGLFGLLVGFVSSFYAVLICFVCTCGLNFDRKDHILKRGEHLEMIYTEVGSGNAGKDGRIYPDMLILN